MKFFEPEKTKNLVAHVAFLTVTSAGIVITTEILWRAGEKLITHLKK